MKLLPKMKNFMCVNSHPSGCYKNVQQEAIYSKNRRRPCKKLNALVIGSSMGYGLSSRISMAFSGHYNTIGICSEREAVYKKIGSAGWYNTLAFESIACAENIYSKSINGDAFSYETKIKTAEIIQKSLRKIDILIYSIASPRKLDPENGSIYHSVIKPVLAPFFAKGYNNRLKSHEIKPISLRESSDTINTMGGDDWVLWILYLLKQGLLADNFKTVTFSYIGPSATYQIYKHGSIGIAKDSIMQASNFLNNILKKIKGRSSVVVNQSMLTQSSLVIPTIPSYLSLLNLALRRCANRKHSIKQMHTLIFRELQSKKKNIDAFGRIRLDSEEVCRNIQDKVASIEHLLRKRADCNLLLDNIRKDFEEIFGFTSQNYNLLGKDSNHRPND